MRDRTSERSGKESKTSITTKRSGLDGEATMNTEPKRPLGMRSLLKRCWFWLGAVGLAAIVVVVSIAATSNTNSLEETFLKINVGMRKAEVDDLIGGERYLSATQRDGRITSYARAYRSWGDPGERYIYVFFGGPEQKVDYVIVSPSWPLRTLWQRIQDEYRYQKSRLGR